jgi:hypothetical protein
VLVEQGLFAIGGWVFQIAGDWVKHQAAFRSAVDVGKSLQFCSPNRQKQPLNCSDQFGRPRRFHISASFLSADGIRILHQGKEPKDIIFCDVATSPKNHDSNV